MATDDVNASLLVSRLENSTHATDRREILGQLKDVAGAHQAQVGRHLPLFLGILRDEAAATTRDSEMCHGALEVVLALVEDSAAGPAGAEDGAGGMSPPGRTRSPSRTAAGGGATPIPGAGGSPAAAANTEALFADTSNVEVLLDLLSDSELWTRLLSIMLLTRLTYARPDLMAATVLRCPAGLMRLVDVLEDGRDEIRNELLLLLLQLTETNAEVQNFVAFQDGFDKLFRIMREEGMAEGGMIVHDALTIVCNMVRGNDLTRKLFGQGSCLALMPQLLRVTADDLVLPDEGTVAAAAAAGVAPPPPRLRDDMRDIVVRTFELLEALCGPPQVRHAALEAAAAAAAARDAVAAAKRGGASSVGGGSGSGGAGVVSDPALLAREAVSETLQRKVAATPGLLDAVVLLACGGALPSDLDAPARAAGLRAIAASAFRHPDQLRELGRHTISLPGAAAHGPAVLTLTASVRVALVSKLPAEAAAARLVWDAFLDANPDGRVGAVGHAITPPPADSMDDAAAPPVPPGRFVVDTLLAAAGEVMRVAQGMAAAVAHAATASGAAAVVAQHRAAMSEAGDLTVRACTALRRMLHAEPTAKELALRVPLHAATMGAPTLTPGDGGDVFSHVCGLAAAAMKPGSGVGLREQVALACVLVEWMFECRSAAEAFVSQPANLFVFDVLGSGGGGGGGAAAGGAFGGGVGVSSGSSEGDDALNGRADVDGFTAGAGGAAAAVDAVRRGVAALAVGVCLEFLGGAKPLNGGGSGGSGGRAGASSSGSGGGGDAPGPITRETVLRMVNARVGVAGFSGALDALLRSAAVRAASGSWGQDPERAVDCVFDTDMAQLAQAVHQRAQRRIVALYTGDGDGDGDGGVGASDGGGGVSVLAADAAAAAAQLKGLVRKQDAELTELRATLRALQAGGAAGGATPAGGNAGAGVGAGGGGGGGGGGGVSQAHADLARELGEAQARVKALEDDAAAAAKDLAAARAEAEAARETVERERAVAAAETAAAVKDISAMYNQLEGDYREKQSELDAVQARLDEALKAVAASGGAAPTGGDSTSAGASSGGGGGGDDKADATGSVGDGSGGGGSAASIAERDAEIARLRAAVETHQAQWAAAQRDATQRVAALQRELSAAQLRAGEAEAAAARAQAEANEARKAEADAEAKTAAAEQLVSQSRPHVTTDDADAASATAAELAELRAEHEDLLVLLAVQGIEKDALAGALRARGHAEAVAEAAEAAQRALEELDADSDDEAGAEGVGEGDVSALV